VTGHHPLAFGENLVEFGRDMKLLSVRHHIPAAADGVDGHFIAALDGEDRLQFRLEKPPVAGLGAGLQVMVCHDGASGWDRGRV
jgi:hypothetical protein